MRWLCLSLGLSLLSFAPARAGHKPPQVFFRINVQTTGSGLSDMQATTIAIPPNGEIIQIRTLPEVSEHDLSDVQADPGGAVHFRFNHQGTVALNAFTSQNQGRIMVVTLNGTVIYAPVIDQQITTGELTIPHPLPPEAVRLLQEEAQKNLKDRART